MVWIRAPKDGFVTRLLVPNGDLVQRGQEILDVDVYQETRDLTRVRALESLIRLAAYRISSEYVTARRVELERTQGLAQKTLEVASVRLAIAQENFKAGIIPRLELTEAERDKLEAENNLEIAEAKISMFDMAINAQIEMHETITGQIQTENAYLSAAKERMSIRSPMTGLISLSVDVDSFVKLGQAIGRVKAVT